LKIGCKTNPEVFARMRPEPTRDQICATIQQHAARKGASLAELSRMVSRSSSYLARFLAGGPPERLALRDRRLLAAFFAIDEWELGARPGEPRYVPRPARRDARR
jgi:AraC-like DNA-binding protein